MTFHERYGPWAIVTGASDGTGREFARAIAAHGISLILVARRQAPLRALAEELANERGVECLIAAIDLAEADAGDRIVAAVGDREVGLYVSNAGADANGARFLDRHIDTWLSLVQRNDLTMMRCCHHFGQAMRERGRGGLLLVNSGACYGGARFMTTYAASKAFTLCFAEGLWDELREHGVDVLTLVMGMTDTPAFRALMADKGLPFPETMAASATAVAKLGLERLPHGPVQNWGETDDQARMSAMSAADRRRRVIAIAAASALVFGD